MILIRDGSKKILVTQRAFINLGSYASSCKVVRRLKLNLPRARLISNEASVSSTGTNIGRRYTFHGLKNLYFATGILGTISLGIGVSLGYAILQDDQMKAIILRQIDLYSPYKQPLVRRTSLASNTNEVAKIVDDLKMRRGWTTFRFWIRLFEIIAIFTPVALLFPFTFLGSIPQQIWNSLLVHALQLGGPMFMKLGQWASTRSDLFSQDLRSSLARLHSTVIYESKRKTKRTLKRATNKLVSFNEEPVGAGVIAQVHVGEFVMDDGTTKKVAVKIRREGVATLIETDLAVLNSIADFIVRHIPKQSQPFSIKNAAIQFSSFMISQIDLRTEFENLLLFTDNFKDNPRIIFPKPIYASEDGAVLVEEFHDGKTLSWHLEHSITHAKKSNINHDEVSEPLNDPKIKKQIAKLGLNAFLHMVLIDNFCHSDLHPGNMMLPNPKTEPDIAGGLVILDAGLVTKLSKSDQENFLDLFTAVATGKGRRAGELMIERTDPALLIATDEQQRRFIDGIDAIVSTVHQSTFSLGKIKFGAVLQDVLTLVYKYQVPIDPNFSSLVLSLVVAEGIMRTLDPDIDIFTSAMPYILFSHPEYKKAVVDKFAQVLYSDLENVYTY